MLLSLESIGNTISQHPWLTLAIFLVTGLLVLHRFSDVALDEVIGGVFRLLGSIFVAPFHFIRTVVTSLAGFTANDGADAQSRTYLLHRSIEYSRLGALVGAILILATGLTVAVLGVWPSEQLEQRRIFREQLSSADASYSADSTRLAALTSTEQAEIARQRAALRDSLQRRRTTLATSVSQFIDSVVALPNPILPEEWEESLQGRIVLEMKPVGTDTIQIARLLLDRLNNSRPGGEVWNDSPYSFRYTEDSAVVAAGPAIRRALKALAQSDSAWRTPQRGFLLTLSALETQVALINALRVGSIEQEIEVVRALIASAESQRESARQGLRRIEWFAGVKFFFVTILYTYFLFVAFVWAAGLAIETTLLFIGIAQDVAAMRKRSE